MLTVAGDIDMVTAPQLRVHVDAVLLRRPPAFIIDLSHVEFLGSAGIGVLVQVHNSDRDMSYAVVARGPATSRPLHLLGLDKMFPMIEPAAARNAGACTHSQHADGGAVAVLRELRRAWQVASGRPAHAWHASVAQPRLVTLSRDRRRQPLGSGS